MKDRHGGRLSPFWLPRGWSAPVRAPSASAQDGPGLRAGLSANPDQFFFGGHYVTKPIWDQLRFQPTVEAGFGDDLTVVAFNVEFGYWMPISAGLARVCRRRPGA